VWWGRYSKNKKFYVRQCTCREVVTDLIEEYKAAEQPDYVTWGGSVTTTQAGYSEQASSSMLG